MVNDENLIRVYIEKDDKLGLPGELAWATRINNDSAKLLNSFYSRDEYKVNDIINIKQEDGLNIILNKIEL